MTAISSQICISYPIDMTRHVLTQGFGENPDIYQHFKVKGLPLQGHNGLDYASPAGQSEAIYAAAEGKIIQVAIEDGGFGIHVLIEHAGFRTLYAHLSDCCTSPGRKVERGSILGTTGSTGFSTGIHLHFGLYPDGESALNGYGGAVDPSPFYGAGGESEAVRPLQGLSSGEILVNPGTGQAPSFTIHYLKPRKRKSR